MCIIRITALKKQEDLNEMTNIDKEKIGKRISALRRERGYTGETLAERLTAVLTACCVPGSFLFWKRFIRTGRPRFL